MLELQYPTRLKSSQINAAKNPIDFLSIVHRLFLTTGRAWHPASTFGIQCSIGHFLERYNKRKKRPRVIILDSAGIIYVLEPEVIV